MALMLGSVAVYAAEPGTTCYSITVSGAAAFSEAWDATVDAPHTLNLSSGQYRLKGANEEIVLLVP